MMNEPASYGDPSSAVFNPRDCGRPMVEAVEHLASQLGRSPGEFVGMSFAELAEMVDATYADDLPEFWRVWKDWHVPQPPPEMGDL